jgi:hypothetical protein
MQLHAKLLSCNTRKWTAKVCCWFSFSLEEFQSWLLDLKNRDVRDAPAGIIGLTTILRLLILLKYIEDSKVLMGCLSLISHESEQKCLLETSVTFLSDCSQNTSRGAPSNIMTRQSGTTTRTMPSRRSFLIWSVGGFCVFGLMVSNLKARNVYDNSVVTLVQEQEVARRASVRGNNNNNGNVLELERQIERLQREVDAASVRAESLEMKRQQIELERNELDRKVQELSQAPRAKANNEKAEQEEQEREFPYPLSCPGTNLKSPAERNYTITLAYHVGMLNNYKNIVTDQMKTLDQCGLGKAASEFILSYSGGELGDLHNLTRPYNLFVNDHDNNSNSSGRPTTIVHTVKAPWEGAVMNQIADYCRARTVENVKSDKPTIVFYFHNKGSSKWAPGWQNALHKPFTYAYSLYWRKFMEYFLLERPELCIDQIVNKGAGSCGIMFNHNHYSGNFWAASCDYLRLIEPIDMDVTQNYIKGELWVGDKRGPEDGRRPYSLIQNPSPTGLYRHLIEPSEYSDYNARWGQSLLAGGDKATAATARKVR